MKECDKRRRQVTVTITRFLSSESFGLAEHVLGSISLCRRRSVWFGRSRRFRSFVSYL
jgi:hypothetical protein